MSLALVAVLVIGGLVGALALIVLVPLTFGLMAYDVVTSRTDQPVQTENASTRIAVERGSRPGVRICWAAHSGLSRASPVSTRSASRALATH